MLYASEKKINIQKQSNPELSFISAFYILGLSQLNDPVFLLHHISLFLTATSLANPFPAALSIFV